MFCGFLLVVKVVTGVKVVKVKCFVDFHRKLRSYVVKELRH